MTVFVRKLGSAPGVQLNNLRERGSAGLANLTYDRNMAAMGRAMRGNPNKVIELTPENVDTAIGTAYSLRDTPLNRTAIAVVDALNNGVEAIYYHRLVDSTATNKYVVATSGTDVICTPSIVDGVIDTIKMTNQGTWYDHPVVTLINGPTAVKESAIVPFTPLYTGQAVVVTFAGKTMTFVAARDLPGILGFAIIASAFITGSVSASEGTITTTGNSAGFTVSAVSGQPTQAKFTATTVGNIADLTLSGTGTYIPVIRSQVTGSSTVYESFELLCRDLGEGQDMTLTCGTDTSTLTATSTMTAEEVAAAFKSSATPAKGTFDKRLTNFDVSASSDANYGSISAKFTAKTYGNKADVTISGGVMSVPKAVITQGDGGLPSYTVTLSPTGSIEAINFTGGTGWKAGTTITIGSTDGEGGGATAVISPKADGTLTGVNAVITNGGSGYTVPEISVSGKHNVSPNPRFSVSINKNGLITAITPRKSPQNLTTDFAYAYGFSLTDTVTISPSPKIGIENNAVNATASIGSIKNGVITRIIPDAGIGEDFINVTNLNVTIPVNNGAKATAFITDNAISLIAVNEGGSNYSLSDFSTQKITVRQEGNVEFSLSNDFPETNNYLFVLRHNDCFNDGIKIKINADKKRVGVVNVNNSIINLVITDKDDVLLHEFKGSLDKNSVDAWGNTLYLPDIVKNLTDSIDIFTGSSTSISPISEAYGTTPSGTPNWAESQLLLCFYEGKNAYSFETYQTARENFEKSNYRFGYICNCDNYNITLISQLAQLAYTVNARLLLDLQFDPLNPKETAIAFLEQFDFAGMEHLIQAFLNIVSSVDITGRNGRDYYGQAARHIGWLATHNSRTNEHGISRKQQPIMGRAFPIFLGGAAQDYEPSQEDLIDFTDARINLVTYKNYQDGTYIVFSDALTLIKDDDSPKKLASVVDMSIYVDSQITTKDNELIGLPMAEFISKANNFRRVLFRNIKTAGWLRSSNDSIFKTAKFGVTDNSSYLAQVRPSKERPLDVAISNYWVHYEGAVRQIYETQTLTRR